MSNVDRNNQDKNTTDDFSFTDDRRLAARSWMIVIAIPAAFLVWGFFLFFMIGNKGSPAWDFSVVEDIPGKSAYSTGAVAGYPNLPVRTIEKVAPQHVNGPTEEGAKFVGEPATGGGK
jgi:hypothetical protein